MEAPGIWQWAQKVRRAWHSAAGTPCRTPGSFSKTSELHSMQLTCAQPRTRRQHSAALHRVGRVAAEGTHAAATRGSRRRPTRMRARWRPRSRLAVRLRLAVGRAHGHGVERRIARRAPSSEHAEAEPGREPSAPARPAVAASARPVSADGSHGGTGACRRGCWRLAAAGRADSCGAALGVAAAGAASISMRSASPFASPLPGHRLGGCCRVARGRLTRALHRRGLSR